MFNRKVNYIEFISLIMIGAILAGGYGKRLKPITDHIPKALVEIKDNYTIMDRQLFDFKNIGIRDVYILSGYLSEKIEERYKNYRDINIHYLREEKPMGTLFSLKNLMNNIDDDVIVRNGDTVTDINFKNFVETAKTKDYGMLMYVTKMKSPYGIVEFSGDKIYNFKEKPELNYYINAGMYYIKKSIFNVFFGKYIERDIEKSVFPYIVKNNEMGVYNDDTLWIGIDSEKDLSIIRREYEYRDDTLFGYIKHLYNLNNKKIDEYYIRSGEEIVINETGIIKINYGAGYIDNEKYDGYKIFTVDKPFKVSVYENTSIDIIRI